MLWHPAHEERPGPRIKGEEEVVRICHGLFACDEQWAVRSKQSADKRVHRKRCSEEVVGAYADVHVCGREAVEAQLNPLDLQPRRVSIITVRKGLARGDRACCAASVGIEVYMERPQPVDRLLYGGGSLNRRAGHFVAMSSPQCVVAVGKQGSVHPGHCAQWVEDMTQEPHVNGRECEAAQAACDAHVGADIRRP